MSRTTSTYVAYRDQTTNQKRSTNARKGATHVELEHLYPGTSYKIEVSHIKSGIESDSVKTILQTIITYDTPTLKVFTFQTNITTVVTYYYYFEKVPQLSYYYLLSIIVKNII